MTDVEPTHSDRGFVRFPPVPSRYGGEVRAYGSSAALGPHVWLAVKSSVNMTDRTRFTSTSTAHLTLEDAAVLRDQLTYLIEHHYQVADRQKGRRP